MYQIKKVPEDFQVDEITNIERKDSGRYIYYKLKKRNYTVLRALGHIANTLNIQLKRIGFAGTKDKAAITTQYISFDSLKREKIDKIGFKDITLDFYGYGDSPISLGDLEGNRFTIIVRDVEDKPVHIDKIVNYFGPQRFSDNNIVVGKALLKKEFRKAVEMIAENDAEFTVQSEIYLESKPNDFIGLLRRLPKKLLMLYIHSYQGYIWNETVQRMIKKGMMKDYVTIVGFGSVIESDEKGIIDGLLKNEGIVARDFILPSIPELTSEGDRRKMFANVKELKIGELEDDEYSRKNKCKISFTLPKGSYATVALQQMFP